MLHSIVRWILVAVAVAAAIRFAITWLRSGSESGMDRGLMGAFVGLLDLQMLLGLIYLIGDGLSRAGFPLYRIEHAGTMVIAVALGHFALRRWRAPSPTRVRNNFLVVLAVIVLIFAGISRLPQGWF